MVSSRELIEQLWDQFEFAFLEALARQRGRLPGPPRALVDQLRLLVST